MNNSADTTRSPYVVVSSEYLPPPGYESVTATTSSASLLPQPLHVPPRESSEAPSLPAPYDSGVDTLLESVVNESVQNDVVVTKDKSKQGDVFSNEKSADETKDDIDDNGQEVIVEHLYVMVKAEPGADSDDPTRVVYAQVNKKKQKPVRLTGSAAAGIAEPIKHASVDSCDRIQPTAST